MGQRSTRLGQGKVYRSGLFSLFIACRKPRLPHTIYISSTHTSWLSAIDRFGVKDHPPHTGKTFVLEPAALPYLTTPSVYPKRALSPRTLAPFANPVHLSFEAVSPYLIVLCRNMICDPISRNKNWFSYVNGWVKPWEVNCLDSYWSVLKQ